MGTESGLSKVVWFYFFLSRACTPGTSLERCESVSIQLKFDPQSSTVAKYSTVSKVHTSDMNKEGTESVQW